MGKRKLRLLRKAEVVARVSPLYERCSSARRLGPICRSCLHLRLLRHPTRLALLGQLPKPTVIQYPPWAIGNTRTPLCHD